MRKRNWEWGRDVYNVQNRDNLSNFDTSNVYSYVKRFCPVDIIRNRAYLTHLRTIAGQCLGMSELNNGRMPVYHQPIITVDQKFCSQYLSTKHICHWCSINQNNISLKMTSDNGRMWCKLLFIHMWPTRRWPIGCKLLWQCQRQPKKIFPAAEHCFTYLVVFRNIKCTFLWLRATLHEHISPSIILANKKLKIYFTLWLKLTVCHLWQKERVHILKIAFVTASCWH